eukprot:2612088-Amphidinium_carterae.1
MTTYVCLQEPRLQDILEHVQQQTIPIHDENYAESRLAEEGLSYDNGYQRAQGELATKIVKV